mgnify:CR=1 FL=1
MKLNLNKTELKISAGLPKQFPAENIPQVAFAGRSNVGKSSLINRVLGRKSIARVSSTPGKTVTVNFYRLSEARLVDLPGYGYAKVADKERERWAELMEGYFRSGRNIKLCLQLVDMRHKTTDFDISMLEFLRHFDIPYAVVLTKCDKLNKSEFAARLKAVHEELGDLANDITIIPFSALKGTGTEEIRSTIEKSLQE